MPPLHRDELAALAADDSQDADAFHEFTEFSAFSAFSDVTDPRHAETARDRRRERARQRKRPRDALAKPPRPRARENNQAAFKCGRCKAFIGPTVSGGRHRNHCPLCLTSRHVDHRRPGDRASPCRALMAPVGTAFRPKGEQIVVHRCNGCGRERRNRVAADDNPLALIRLPLLSRQLSAVSYQEPDDADLATGT